MKLYNWQRKVIDSYSGGGTVKAVTGAGKSLIGLEIAKNANGKILVSAPRLPILNQWKLIMKNIDNVQFETFQSLCKKQIINVDLLIVDECHRSTSPEFVKLYDNIKYKKILGLSATPNKESVEKCGRLLCDVGYNEANVSPFIVKFHGIELTFRESFEYRRISYAIGKLMQKEHLSKDEKQQLDGYIFNRRGLVYSAEKRVPFALKLIQDNWKKGNKMLVICQRIEQANKLSEQLRIIPHILYHSGKKDDLEKYRSGKVQVCISVGMLKEGFDDPGTNIGIIVSTPLSESFNIHAIGRIIRYKPKKFAEVHIILANRTSDSKVLQFSGNYDFELENIRLPENPEVFEQYYGGEKYSFCEKRIWKKGNGGRIYMEYDEIIEKVRKVKPSGGSFVVSPNGVYAKVNDTIVKISSDKVDFIPIKNEKTSSEPVSWKSIEKMWK